MVKLKRYFLILIFFMLTGFFVTSLAFTCDKPITANAYNDSNGTNTEDVWKGSQTTDNLIYVSDGNASLQSAKSLAEFGWQNVGHVYPYSRHYTHKEVDLKTESYGWGIQAENGDDDIGNKNYGNGVWYRITLSPADRIKANNGTLSVSASSVNYRQGLAGCVHQVSLKLFFDNAEGQQIDSEEVEKEIKDSAYTLSIANRVVPANTASIRYYVSNRGSLSARPFIGGLICTLTDTTAPTATNSALVENAVITDRGGAIAGDTVQYSITFDEKISVVNPGTASISVAGTTVNSNSYTLTESGGISIVTYDFIIPEIENNGKISFSGVSGVTVQDEAGNTSSDITYTGAPGTLDYYAKADVTVNCSNLTYSGNMTARFGTDTTITLSANRGYNLPSAVTVTIGGAQFFNSYNYNASDGRVTIYGPYIQGGITITAAGVAKEVQVTFDRQSGTGGSNGVTATFNKDLQAITPPSRTGYTFAGYYERENGNGNKYYDEYGNGVKVSDFVQSTTLYANWTANTYTVTYNSNKPSTASGTIGGTTAGSTHTYDTASPLTTNGYSLIGWTYSGWNTRADGQGTTYTDGQNVSTLVSENNGSITLYAVWTANTYTVAYNPNKPSTASGTIDGTTESSTHTYDTASPLTTNGYSLIGWTFSGWNTRADGQGTAYTDGQNVSTLVSGNNGSITLYAVWTANTYTVTYNSNKPSTASGTIDGTTESSKHTYDTASPLTTNSYSLIGWTFSGWNTRADGQGTAYTDGQNVSTLVSENDGSITLYAVWTANTYTVTYNSNRPSNASNEVIGTTESSTHTYDTASPLTTNNYSLTGWTFSGWNTRADGQGTSCTDGQNVSTLVSENNGSITLYAVWTANTYTLYYNTAGGSGAGSNTVTYDAVLPELHIVPARNGYSFLGYYDRADGQGNLYYNEDGSAVRDLKYLIADNLTLYAYWKPVTYTVVLYSEGNYVSSLECTFGSLTLPSADTLGLTRENYDFVGWNIYDEQNWSMYSADKEYKVGLTNENGAEITVYAAWLERPLYLLSYDANGGIKAPQTVQIHQGEKVFLSEQKPVRENYTFKGWSEDAESGAEYFPGGEFTMGDTTVTVYAVWSKNPALSYDANGGEFYSEVIVTYPEIGQTVTFTSVVPHRKGYDFTGWSTTPSADGNIYVTSFDMPETDTVLYAVWEIQSYTVHVSAPDGYTVEEIYDGEKVEFGTEIRFTVNGDNAAVYAGGVRISPSDGGVYVYVVEEETEIKISDGTELFLLYVANGGTGAPIDKGSYLSGSTATVAAAPDIKRTGYAFLGWSTDKEAPEAEYSKGDTLTFKSDTVTLYAVWEANVYYVKYYSEGVASDTVSEFVYDEANTLLLNPFNKNGYTFEGWAIEEGGKAVYSDGAEVMNLAADNGAEITLYAVWKETVTEVIFNLSGGIDGSESMAIAFGTEPETETVLPPVRKGYIFIGYFTAPEGGVMVFDKGMNLVNTMSGYSLMRNGESNENLWLLNEESVTLYAVYEGVNYSVIYIDGEEIKGSQSAIYGEAFSLQTASSMNVTAPENYTFAGWSTVPEGVVAYADGQQITNGLAETEGAEFYLYAVFEENEKIKVYYDANGGMNAPVDNNGYYINTDISISSVIPEKEGYIFAGWGYDNKVVTYSYSVETGEFTPPTFSATEDVRLYAVWTAGELLQNQIDDMRTTATELGTAIEDLKTADTEINGQITELLNRIIAAEEAMQSPDDTFATDAELAAAVNELKTALEGAKTELKNAIDTVQSNLDTAVEELNGSLAAEVSTLNDKITALDTAYKAADTLINSDIAALKGADENIKASITALDTAYKAADTELKNAIETVQSNLDTAVEELNGSLTAEVSTLNDKITAFNTAYKAADTIINSEIAALKDTDENIKASITALDTAYKAADTELKNAIDTVQSNLDTAVEELNGSLAAEVSTLNDKITALDTAYKAADTIINSEIAALKDTDENIKASITALDTAYKAADTALQMAIETVQDNLDSAVEELNGSLTAGVETLNGKITALENAYKAADTIINSEIAALKDTDINIKASITALESAYKAADEALKSAIEELQKKLDAVQKELEGKDKQLETEINNITEERDRLAMIYMWINITLGVCAAVLLITLILKAVKAKKQNR